MSQNDPRYIDVDRQDNDEDEPIHRDESRDQPRKEK